MTLEGVDTRQDKAFDFCTVLDDIDVVAAMRAEPSLVGCFVTHPFMDFHDLSDSSYSTDKITN